MGSSSQPARTRSERVASLTSSPGPWSRLIGWINNTTVSGRISLCILAAALVWLVTGSWQRPFPYRSGDLPHRDIVARVRFSTPDLQRTEESRRQRRRDIFCVYIHDARPLKEMRSALKSDVFEVLRTEKFEDLAKSDTWKKFLDQKTTVEGTEEEAFERFRAALAHDSALEEFGDTLESAFSEIDKNGLLEKPAHSPDDGSHLQINVYSVGQPQLKRSLEMNQVRIANVLSNLEERLAGEFRRTRIPPEYIDDVKTWVFQWLESQGLPTTLQLDALAMEKEYYKIDKSPPVEEVFFAGQSIVTAGRPLTRNDISKLESEFAAVRETTGWANALLYSLAICGMYVALYILCGVYVYYHQPKIISDLRQFSTLLGTVVVCVALSRICALEPTRAEIIPILLFGMTMGIAYHRETALLLSAAVTLIIVLSLGMRLGDFVILTATVSAAVLLLNRIRTRTKLIYVGAGAAAVAFSTTLGVGTVTGDTFGVSGAVSWLHLDEDTVMSGPMFMYWLFIGSAWYAFCAFLAGLIITGLLPFVERLFDVQTDISLLELGDARHPLLQELARRAPGTYNHSINVASLGEAAAEAIGANGLLVRVGAYFHDIGKMMNPEYFVENQTQKGNRHESLMPAMSTLVIVAHVKDGADLAKQYHLPKSIIDFIEQHHGTTLVEYFYQQATKRSEDDPDSPEVDDADFRYPGPKPQTREAGVMMLADAAESASRTLVDPAPARIESLVHELAMKRLLDDQFDDCGLTLQELSVIEQSLVKSLTAVYHGRIKYPNQQSA